MNSKTKLLVTKGNVLRLLAAFIMLATLHYPLHAQQQTITGKIISAADQSPLQGVTVMVVNSSHGTVSGMDGAFTINAPIGSTLNFSITGFASKSIKISGGDLGIISMEADLVALDSVVVIGYGTQKKVNLTGAVSTVPVKTLQEAPVTNFSNTLAGRLPGVIAINGSGEPGADGSSILIRGNHSLNNNAPLVVVDGVPTPSEILERINPNDIENISVLKDATASIYGSESANGVILITTKQGRKNQSAQVTLNLNQGYNQPSRIPKMAGAIDYMEMLNEAAIYHGTTAQFSKETIEAYKDPNRDPWLYPSTDWFNEGLKKLSPQTNGNLSVQGGTAALTYFLSLGGLTQDGYYKQSATRYNQFNIRSNITSQVSKNIKIGLNLSGRKEDRNFPTVSAGQIFRMLMRGRPTDPAFFPNGLPGPDQEGGNQPVVTGTPATGYDHNQRYYMTGNLSLDITIPGVEGLSIRGLLSYNKQFQEVKVWKTPWNLYTFDKQAYINNDMQDPESFLTAFFAGPTDPSLSQNYYQEQKILENIVANYKRSFGDHDITLMGGAESQRFNDNTFNAFRRNYISTSISELFAGSQENWTNNGSSAKGSRVSYFGRIDYAYQHKYLFQIVGRYDGSYLFPEDSRFGFFPAFSGGWRISEEPFFKNNVSFVDELKIRGSWGKTGNDITNPDALVEAQQYYSGFQFGSGYVLGIDQIAQNIAPTYVANPYITWERANQFNVGIDGALLKNRLSFTVDYWNQLRSGILIARNASVPQSTGLTLPKENLGKVKSWGYDGNITLNQKLNEDLSFNVSLNAGYSTTRIIFWDEPPGSPAYQVSTGKKISTGLYYKAIGIFQNEKQVEDYPHWNGARPGDIIFEDVDGNGIINADDRIRVNKNTTPVWTGGISLGLNWKQLSARIFFQGSAGDVQYVSTESGDIGNYLAEFASQRWRPDPDDLTGMTAAGSAPYSGPRTFDRGDTYWTTNNNTYFLRSTDYIRLKSVEIGYSLPHTLLKKLGGINDFRIYVNGYNLLTWDKFKIMDPEASNAAGDYYPQTRVYNIGFNLTF
ncbi:SusC/RagA family TonB-linked outer membrane protein [Parafilimonas sp.]|uniref:SusC/RagA family TonB-linked outer membrane protein n=1 Tax=Parafilimonas sp. TaxID=1969739 RepID=UPI003F7D0FEA